MIGKIMAAMLGSAIDRSDGDGGAMGAVIAMGAETVLRRLGPVGWVIGAIWAVVALILGLRKRPRAGGSARSAAPRAAAAAPRSVPAPRRPSVTHLRR